MGESMVKSMGETVRDFYYYKSKGNFEEAFEESFEQSRESDYILVICLQIECQGVRRMVR